MTGRGGSIRVEADDVPDGGDGEDGGDGTDGTDGGDGSDGEDGEDEYKPSDDGGDEESTPGFGSATVLGALAVVGAAMILARRRREN